MEGFDQFGLQNDVLSEAGFEAYEAAKMQRTNDIRAMQLDTISLSQQLGLRQEGFAEDNAEETVTLVDGPFTTFLDIPQLPLLAVVREPGWDVYDSKRIYIFFQGPCSLACRYS
jgi:hypothetical protein